MNKYHLSTFLVVAILSASTGRADQYQGGSHFTLPVTPGQQLTDLDVMRAINDPANYDYIEIPQGVTVYLHNPIVFPRPNFTLRTVSSDGNVSQAQRATLLVMGTSVATAAAIMDQQSNTHITDLTIDGNRHGATPEIQKGNPLIALHSASNQEVARNTIENTPTWSSLQCDGGTQAWIHDNLIQYAGQPSQSNVADGISLSCPQSKVFNNTIKDATDGGIVLFNTAGSDIYHNTIVSVGQPANGGILAVDNVNNYYKKDGTLIHDNFIIASGHSILVGIGVGGYIWWDSISNRVSGVTVGPNTFQGSYFGVMLAVHGGTGTTLYPQYLDGAACEQKRGCLSISSDPTELSQTQFMDWSIVPEPTAAAIGLNAIALNGTLLANFHDDGGANVRTVASNGPLSQPSTSTGYCSAPGNELFKAATGNPGVALAMFSTANAQRSFKPLGNDVVIVNDQSVNAQAIFGSDTDYNLVYDVTQGTFLSLGFYCQASLSDSDNGASSSAYVYNFSTGQWVFLTAH